jgi:hypothetical protein
MLTMSRVQMNALDEQWMERLLARVRQAVRVSADPAPSAPIQPAGPAVDEAAIDKCIAWALDFGLSEAEDLAAAAALLVALHQHDHQGSLGWVKPWLEGAQATPPTRMEMVCAQLSDLAAAQPVAAQVKAQVQRARQAAGAR